MEDSLDVTVKARYRPLMYDYMLAALGPAAEVSVVSLSCGTVVARTDNSIQTCARTDEHTHEEQA